MSWQVELRLSFAHFSLSVTLEGESTPVALIGPNGSGKTTLLRTIVGAYKPAYGQIRVGNNTLLDTQRGLDLPPEERRVGYVPQGYGLFPHLTVEENVAFGLKGSTKRERLARAQEWLSRFGCSHLVGRLPEALSGGERQRVALARATIIEPQLLLLDEPLAALDVSARRKMRTTLSDDLARHNTPIIIATHDRRDLDALCERAYVIEAGNIVQSGPIQELREQPATPFVEEFFDISP